MSSKNTNKSGRGQRKSSIHVTTNKRLKLSGANYADSDSVCNSRQNLKGGKTHKHLSVKEIGNLEFPKTIYKFDTSQSIKEINRENTKAVKLPQKPAHKKIHNQSHRRICSRDSVDVANKRNLSNELPKHKFIRVIDHKSITIKQHNGSKLLVKHKHVAPFHRRGSMKTNHKQLIKNEKILSKTIQRLFPHKKMAMQVKYKDKTRRLTKYLVDVW